jgi:hypothetical protein
VLHEDDARAVGADDLVCVAEEEGQTGACKHEHNEGNVCAIADGLVLCDVDVSAEGDL